ncbi:citrate transporter [Lacticaseibacillus paracasei]|uniref:SLC13 family permease n=1 Tax=Lacticaseibacillus paracasei TaxID=1597 RepID=UPI001BA5F88B|nr:citrate transporter [Lacticaseibacillus paracasei]
MSYLAFMGFAMMILITVLLMKQKVSTIFCFTVIPVIFAILVGANITQIGSYVSKGILKTYEIALMMMFSMPYFTLMSDAGMFDYIVKAIMKRVRLTAPIICMLTVIVASICELDSSVLSVFLITIPLMLPLYKKFNIDTKILPFLCSASVILMTSKPWDARMLRAASLTSTKNASTVLFLHMLPVQLIGMVGLLALAAFLGFRQMKNRRDKAEISREELVSMIKDTELSRPKLFLPNLLLTALVIFCLCAFPDIPQYFVFAVGLVLAMMLNYGDQKLQTKLLKKYYAALWPVTPAVLLSGVVVGVMQYSGMLNEMVKVLMAVIPAAIGPWVYLILAMLATPLMFVFTNDTWFYALIPIVAAFSNKYGIPTDIVIMTMFMNFGAMVSPVAQPQIYVATDLTDKMPLATYVKYSFWKLWGMNIAWTVVGFVLGVFR